MSCPNCGSTEVEQKTKGYLKGPDKNPAKCLSCDWEGKVWQLEERRTSKLDKLSVEINIPFCKCGNNASAEAKVDHCPGRLHWRIFCKRCQRSTSLCSGLEEALREWNG